MIEYNIKRTSYDSGDFSGTTYYRFTTSEVRDDFFNYLYEQCKLDKYLHERKEYFNSEQFVFDNGGRWSYEYEKENENHEIIESFNIDKNGRVEYNYK